MSCANALSSPRWAARTRPSLGCVSATAVILAAGRLRAPDPLWPYLRAVLLRVQQHEQHGCEPEQRAQAGEDDGAAAREARVLAARERLVDVPVSEVAVDHEDGADDRERDADQLKRPFRATGKLRDEAAGPDADRERGQARTPLGEVGALVGESRPACRVAGVVELG